MSTDETLKSLATKVRTMRNLQSRYFRTKRDDKAEKEKVLRSAKACEAEVDKMISRILDDNYDS
ncbi:hypothetical protein SAMN05216327_101225 [Dyadobacter sp. SG02]|uniref:hypothetical protein n=1 Tax=Dyadobacter sp. SG02 TaxID=1855291 RepID=UPI0008AC8CFF|nr:hypothetical protein [Dyadobacter sp. SG02]SEI39753.1 hypothetical protein SAMN05216327_101225 [Dyadobacter sp. SG02]